MNNTNTSNQSTPKGSRVQEFEAILDAIAQGTNRIPPEHMADYEAHKHEWEEA